jgi:hypothetical protein
LVENNYTLASVDTSRYKFAESQEDSINFGASTTGNFTSGIIARNNYITGGHSASGCGLIAETGANGAQFLSNTLVDTGQCGIAIADGKNHLVDSNRVLNSTPVSGGGNTAIYVWKVNSSDPHCGPVQISNNIASATAFDSSANSFWNGGGCEPVTMTNNTFDAAAQQALSSGKVKLPPPSVPPQPNNCVIASPFTNNVSLPACGSGGVGGTTPQTIAILSPAFGATVSGTITISTIVSPHTTWNHLRTVCGEAIGDGEEVLAHHWQMIESFLSPKSARLLEQSSFLRKVQNFSYCRRKAFLKYTRKT